VYQTFDTSNYCVAVNLPTDDREIPGLTPGKYNLQIKITSLLEPLRTQLQYTLQHTAPQLGKMKQGQTQHVNTCKYELSQVHIKICIFIRAKVFHFWIF